jgi:hypothetical protein
MARCHELLEGAIDLHTYSSPSFFDRLQARAAGVRRILVTHPDLKLSGIGIADQKALADAGAVLEKDVNTLGPPWHSTTLEAMIPSIREVGPARCVLATDYGQLHSPAPVEGLRIFIQLCLEQGISEADIRTMVAENPALARARLSGAAPAAPAAPHRPCR